MSPFGQADIRRTASLPLARLAFLGGSLDASENCHLARLTVRIQSATNSVELRLTHYVMAVHEDCRGAVAPEIFRCLRVENIHSLVVAQAALRQCGLKCLPGIKSPWTLLEEEELNTNVVRPSDQTVTGRNATPSVQFAPSD